MMLEKKKISLNFWAKEQLASVQNVNKDVGVPSGVLRPSSVFGFVEEKMKLFICLFKLLLP